MTPAGAPGDPWPRRLALLVAAFTVLRAVLASILPLSGDEAYYWDCSRHLDWCYFDQPPLVIWAMIPFRALLGETSLAVRAPALVSSALLAAFLVPLVRRLGGTARDAFRAYLLMHAMPVFLFGGFYASTDTVMITAFTGATWAAVAIAQGEGRAWWGFGLACGLGFLGKFPVVLVAAALIPALLRKEVRAHLRTATPWLAAAMSVALTAPVWIWGARHHWDNLAFQLAGRHDDHSYLGFKYLGEFVTANLGLATPFLAVAMLVALWPSRGRNDAAWWTVRAAAASPLVVFGLVSLTERVGGHWASPALVLAAAASVLVPFPGRRWLYAGAAILGPGLCAVLFGLVLFPEPLLDSPWARREAGAPLRGDLAYLFGNREVARVAAGRMEGAEWIVSDSYTMVHLLGFLNGGAVPTRLADVSGGAHGLASLYWHEPGDLRGRDALVVSARADAGERVAPLFRWCEAEAPIEVERRGSLVRRVHVWRCDDLREPVPAFTRLD